MLILMLFCFLYLLLLCFKAASCQLFYHLSAKRAKPCQSSFLDSKLQFLQCFVFSVTS